MGRSLGFGSIKGNFRQKSLADPPRSVAEIRPVQARFRYGSSTLDGLTSLPSVTRRFIMQKARHHAVREQSPRT